MTATTERTGIGHQLQANHKALQSAKHSIELAYGDLMPLQVKGSFGFPLNEVMNKLSEAIAEIEGLSYACQERYNQND